MHEKRRRDGNRSPSALTCAKLAVLCAWLLLHRVPQRQLSPALRRGAFFVAIVRPALTVATAGITHRMCALLLRRAPFLGVQSPR